MEPKKIEWNSESPLPSVFPEHFQLDASGMYWFDHEGVKHKIVRAGVCANGVRDMCIYWHGPAMDDVRVGKIAEVAKEQILWIPKGDILWMSFVPPLADGKRAFFVDVAERVIWDMVRKMFQMFPAGKKGQDYEMFGGQEYRSVEP